MTTLPPPSLVSLPSPSLTIPEAHAVLDRCDRLVASLFSEQGRLKKRLAASPASLADVRRLQSIPAQIDAALREWNDARDALHAQMQPEDW